AQIGREWYVQEMGDLKTALDYGDRCWSRILSNWATVREQGLTRHENWWPLVYEQACRTWGVEPDRKVLAYSTTYEAQRAERQGLSWRGGPASAGGGGGPLSRGSSPRAALRAGAKREIKPPPRTPAPPRCPTPPPARSPAGRRRAPSPRGSARGPPPRRAA